MVLIYVLAAALVSSAVLAGLMGFAVKFALIVVVLAAALSFVDEEY